ncbi:MAG: tRNA (guanosine(37)-N1)-methyltransferase TrmD [Desulfobacterales bacterium]
MHFSVLTIFPELLASFKAHGIVRRAIERDIISLAAVNIREFATDRHQVTDDRPYGGGSGMVMKPEPLAAAIQAARHSAPTAAVVLMTPQGRVFDQHVARELASLKGLIFVCGRYEGIDERINLNYIDVELSVGDFVLTGGELPAMTVIDAVTRLLPNALGGEDAAEKDSFADDRLEHAQYTRPPLFEGRPPPEVLLSGHHAAIANWRFESAVIRTFLKRRDLLEKRTLSRREIEVLKKWCADIERIIDSQSLPGPGPLPGDQ